MCSFGISIVIFLIAIFNCDYGGSSWHIRQYNLREPVCPETAEQIRFMDSKVMIPVELDLGKKLLLIYDRIAADRYINMKIKKMSARSFVTLLRHLMNNFLEREDREDVKDFKNVFDLLIDTIKGLEFGAWREYERQKQETAFSLLRDDDGELAYEYEDSSEVLHDDSSKVNDLFSIVG